LKQVVQATGQGLRFEGVTTGIDTTGSNSNGILSLIDSSATNTSTLINAGTTSTASNSLVLENVIVDSSVAAVCHCVFLSLSLPMYW
jgi:glucan 1,3-beta-glucosidase